MEGHWFQSKPGLVGKDQQSNHKTEASRRGLPMLRELADVLREWRKHAPYPRDEDWVFCFALHRRATSLLATVGDDRLRQASSKKAGVKKLVNWHGFRHSLGTILKASGEDVKTIQKQLRHANSRITLDVYMVIRRPSEPAISNVSGIFVVKKPAA